MTIYKVKKTGEADQVIEADQLLANEEAKTFDFHKEGSIVACIDIDSEVQVSQEPAFVDPHSLR